MNDPIKVSLQKRTGWFQFRYRVNGRYIRKKVGTKDKKVAEQRRLELEISLNSDNPEDRKAVKRIFVSEYMTIFLREYGKENYAEGTYYIYEKYCKVLLPHLGEKLLNEVTTEDIIVMLNKVKSKKGLSNASHNRYRSLLSKMFNFAIDTGYSKHNPVSRVSKLKEHDKSKDIKYLNEDETKRFLASCLPSFYPIAATFIYTGIRRGELCGLKWGNVNFENEQITISHSFDKPTKDRDTRILPMHPHLKDILLKQYTATGTSTYVFPDSNGNMRRGDFRKVLSSTLTRAGINKKHGIHDLRHTFATMFLKTGSIYTLKELLGHSDIKTTEIYSHVSNEFEFKKNEISKLPVFSQ